MVITAVPVPAANAAVGFLTTIAALAVQVKEASIPLTFVKEVPAPAVITAAATSAVTFVPDASVYLNSTAPPPVNAVAVVTILTVMLSTMVHFPAPGAATISTGVVPIAMICAAVRETVVVCL